MTWKHKYVLRNMSVHDERSWARPCRCGDWRTLIQYSQGWEARCQVPSHGLDEPIWNAHRAQIAAVIEKLFRRCERMPPTAPDELAAGFMALAHGPRLQRPSGTGKAPARIMITFLRGLIAGAERASWRHAWNDRRSIQLAPEAGAISSSS
jgi:hypothetical protein